MCQLHELAGWERGAGIVDASIYAIPNVGEDSVFSSPTYAFAYPVAWLSKDSR